MRSEAFVLFSVAFTVGIAVVNCLPQFGFGNTKRNFGNSDESNKFKQDYVQLSNNKINNSSGTIKFWNSAFISDESVGSFGKDVEDSDIRKELCPLISPFLFDQFRYDNNYKICSKVGQRSHCPENMIFYAEVRNEVYGECDCSSVLGQKPMVYYKPHTKCYFIYEQAYCKKGHWLRFSHQGQPECVRRTCDHNTVPYKGDGECVELNKYYEDCENKNQIVTFAPGEPVPRCSEQVLSIKSISPFKQLACKPGSYMNIVGRCQPPFQYTW